MDIDDGGLFGFGILGTRRYSREIGKDQIQDALTSVQAAINAVSTYKNKIDKDVVARMYNTIAEKLKNVTSEKGKEAYELAHNSALVASNYKSPISKNVVIPFLEAIQGLIS